MKTQVSKKAVFRDLIALIIILIIAGCSNPEKAQLPSPPQLRILTYNIHHGEAMDRKFDYDRLAKVINDLNPDIVAMQEVDNKTKRASGVEQAALLGKLCNMNHAFGQAMPYQGGQYGEAILSRFPMENIVIHPLPYHPGQEPRAVIVATIKPDNGLPVFIFAGTHLCHQNNDTRKEQVQRLNQLFPEKDGPPVILAGDFNARPGSTPMLELLPGRWIDTVAPDSRIDYILIRPADPWEILEVNIVDETVVSDHKPILVVLQWKGK